MQIFKINKKNADVLVFSGITIISKGKALKKEKESWKKRRLLLIMVMSEQTCPLQKCHFRLGQDRRIVILKTKPKQQDILLRIMHKHREIDNVPVLCNASWYNKHGPGPTEHEPFFKLRQKNQETMSTWKFCCVFEWCIWCMLCINADAEMTLFGYRKDFRQTINFANI